MGPTDWRQQVALAWRYMESQKDKQKKLAQLEEHRESELPTGDPWLQIV